MLYLASGVMRTTYAQIWPYFILACAFGVESFIIEMMKHPLKIEKNSEVVNLCLGKYF